jgi:AcrR family transcriptional regulator
MEIKDRITHHAMELFMRNGIKSVSMDDIAASMAMSKKTLYKWFENKDQIVQAGMDAHLTLNQRECQQIIGGAQSAIDELFGMMGWMKEQFANVHPSIFYDLQKFHPISWQRWLEHKQGFLLDQIKDNLRRGVTEGLYRADLEVEVLARLRLAQIEMMFDPTLYPPRQFDIQRLSVVLLEHFMLGMATIKGHRLINEYRHVTEEE